MFQIRGPALKEPVRLTVKEIGYFRSADLCGTVRLAEKCGTEKTMEISSAELRPLRITVPVRRREVIGYRPRSFEIRNVIFGKVESSADLSAVMELAMKNTSTLRVTVRVMDDKPSQNPHLPPYQRDSVELFVDQDPLGGSGEKYNRFCKQYIAPRGRTPGNTGIKSSFTDRKNGYVWTFDIPVVHRNNFIALDLAVNDSDGDRLKSKLSWSGASDSYRNRRNFIVLELNRGDGAVISAAVRDAGGKILQLRNNENTPFLPTDQWEKQQFRFIPDFDGPGNIVFRASLGTKSAEDLLFRKLSVSGADTVLPAPEKEQNRAWIPAKFRKGVPVTISCELKMSGIVK